MAATPNTLSTSEYWISPDALTIDLNALDNPEYLQVSLLAGSVIMAYRQDVIDYDASLNYRKWTLQAYNNFFDRTDRAYVYAQLEKEGSTALIIYSYDILELTETITSDTEESREVYNVYLGTISSSVNSNGQSIPRTWETSFETGSLSTDKNRNEEQLGEWDKMFRLNKVTDMIEVLKDIASAVIHKLYIGARKILINDVQTSSEEDKDLDASDSVIPTTKFLKESTEAKFHRKDQTDRNPFVQIFEKGVEMGDYTTGLLGTGGAVHVDENGNSHAEFDYLNIRKKALFTEITVQELKHIGGALIISPASMIISSVEETDTGYKCYFNQKDSDGRTIYNEFEKDDQGRCQTFNLEKQENGQVGNRYWWRLVTEIGDDYVVFSKTDADTGSDIPQAGDQVSQLGNRTDVTRQNAQIYSAYGSDSPSRKMYQGINSYSLIGKVIKDEYFDVVTGRFKEVTYGDSYTGNPEKTSYFKNDQDEGVSVAGKVEIQAGSTGAANLDDLPDEIYNAVKIGGENLLLNTGFVGNYETLNLDSSTGLNSSTEMYNTSLDKWTGSAILQKDTDSLSGVSATLSTQQPLSQTVVLIKGENYVISYKAKGTTIKIKCGGNAITQELTAEYKRYSHVFTSNTGNTFEISGDCTICEIKLERGTIATDWCPSVLDPDVVKDEFKSMWYLQDALKGETQILGGLSLTSMIMLGKWTNGVMEKVNAGISGIYNDDTDVAIWAGGTFEQAIETVQKLIGGENLSDDDWKSLAKFVATHGGDVFIRGYIYALGGYFRGMVDLGNGVTRLNADGTGWIGKKDDQETFIDFTGDKLKVNGVLEAGEGSQLGGLKVNANGALLGYSMTVLGSMSGFNLIPNNEEFIRNFIINNIGRAQIYELIFNTFTTGRFEVLLPNFQQISEKIPGIEIGANGFYIDVIVPAYSSFIGISVQNNSEFAIHLSDGANLFDQNGNEITEIVLSKGDVLGMVCILRSIINPGLQTQSEVHYFIKTLRQ